MAPGIGSVTTNMTTTTTSETLTIHEGEVLARQATRLVGTLGHVSEGKSTLIRALTGVKTQRHAKEQERNITIHLGYANCRVWQNRHTGEFAAMAPPAGAGEVTEDWTLIAHFSLVDCPGHEAYLATMLGGASIMDAACLVIAANQAVIPQPQTLEHLIAAELMGLSEIAIIQNKLDLLTPIDAAANRVKICAFTAGSCAEGAPMFPTSAQHGWGTERVLDWLTARPTPPRHLDAPARLTCVRSFDVNRPGRWNPASVPEPALQGAVIGGTLDQGVLAIGDWLEVRPGVLRRDPATGAIVARPLLTRVRGLRCEFNDLPYAVPGSLIAIATDLDPALSIANGMVGQRVGVPGSLPPIVGRILVRIQRLKRDTFSFGKHRVGDRVRLCSNVMTVMATITEIDDKKRLLLTLERPLCVGEGERVSVLRHHEEAGRELLEGAGEIKRVWPWAHVDAPEGGAEAVAPNRRVVWVPQERVDWSNTGVVPAYEDMLSAVMAKKEASSSSSSSVSGNRLGLPSVTTERAPKHTIWTNWESITEILDRTSDPTGLRYVDHLRTWLEAELQTTATEVGGGGALDIRGKYRVEDLNIVVRKYVRAHKRCTQCGGYETGLVKDRVLKVRCYRCNCDNVIAGQ
jgi:translation initiation factor 2 subunit 3